MDILANVDREYPWYPCYTNPYVFDMGLDVMTRYHKPKELLNVALCMAKKIMKLKKNTDNPCNEIDDLAAHAQQIIMEVEVRDPEPGVMK